MEFGHVLLLQVLIERVPFATSKLAGGLSLKVPLQ